MPDDRWQDRRLNGRQQGRIRPRRLGHEVMQGLMRGPDPRRHRLDALALERQQQSSRVAAERHLAVGMTERRRELGDIGFEFVEFGHYDRPNG